MQLKKIALGLAAAATLAASGSAFAQGPSNAEFFPFAEIMSMKMMDKNKDGMVSRQEFLDMMGMAWDMHAKKMNVKGGMMTTQQFGEVLQYLRAGG